MNDQIAKILAQMAALEDDLRSAVHDQESRMFFQIKGKRVEFEGSIKAAAELEHLSDKTGATVEALSGLKKIDDFTLEMKLTEKVDPGFYFFTALTSIYPADEAVWIAVSGQRPRIRHRHRADDEGDAVRMIDYATESIGPGIEDDGEHD